jgi:glutamate racemase
MNTTNSKPIGIFDSGIGGLTVFAQIQKLLPLENLIYLGDTARVPYGTKSQSTIERFALEDAHFLLQHDVKLIIAACNTVSALAMPYLKSHIHVPLLGVIEPAAVKACEETSTGRIGVIGTRATVESRAYEKAFSLLSPSANIFSAACPLFVNLVEENWTDEKETYSIAEKYLRPLKDRNIDTLILGCTHYPLLETVIQKIMGDSVRLIDSACSTALALKKILAEENLTGTQSGGSPQFFVTDEPERFQSAGEKFLGKRIPKVQKAALEMEERTFP